MSKKKNTQPYPIMIIDWDDHSSEDGWVEKEEIDKKMSESMTVTSIGWLIQETDKQYVLAAGVAIDGSMTSIQYILKGTVKKVTLLAK